MLFVKEKRPEVVQQYTDLKITEQVKVIAKQWNELDPSLKEFYVEQARKNFVEYLKTHQDYISSLTPEERETMKRNKVDKKKKLDKRRLKTKLRKLEKPKGPRGPFSLYVSSCMLERRNAPIVQYVKGMSEYWNSMSEEDKEIFYKQAKADKERYLTEMNDWEARMRQEGREDILEELHNLRKKSHVSRKIGSKQGENKKNAQLEEKSGKSTSKITSSDYAGDFFTDGEKTEGKKMSKN
ncbi:transcription factor A, mitochondrial-like isoform X2 [Tachypleus tridentatus]